MWARIKNILSSRAKNLGLEKSLMFRELQEKWDEILIFAIGPVFQKKSKPIRLKNQALIVDCLNSVWANELQIKEKIILGQIRQKFSKLPIEQIRFIS